MTRLFVPVTCHVRVTDFYFEICQARDRMTRNLVTSVPTIPWRELEQSKAWWNSLKKACISYLMRCALRA